ncbi:hypothetical protein [Natrinema soli]|uniref:Uncharacterized protein n=1 Tax=Natrinema soli TaxID=1930624 RepID=A0ABD5SX47_9EURY|nr:hypothetical protein [Natrinema soli]
MTAGGFPEAKLTSSLSGVLEEFTETDGREYEAVDEFPAALRDCPQAGRMDRFNRIRETG